MFEPPRKLPIAEACLSCELTDGREAARFNEIPRYPGDDVDGFRVAYAIQHPPLSGVDACRKIVGLQKIVAKIVSASSDHTLSFETLIGKLVCCDAEQRVQPTRLKVDGEDFQGAGEVEPGTRTTLRPDYRHLCSRRGGPATA